MKPILCVLALLLYAPMPSAVAVEIVRCTGRDGEVRYQDRPCADGEAVQVIRLVDDPVRVPAPAPVASDDALPAQAEPVTGSATALDDPVPAPAAMPAAWVCQREDGTRYLSETGVGERRAVPLAMLGVPARGLADAYGRDAAGVSAPGLSRPGIDRSPGAALGAAYTWVEDACLVASGVEVCRLLEDQRAAAQKRLRYAFSDSAAQVRADIAALDVRLAVCR